MSIVRFTDKKGQKYPYLYIDKVTGVFYVQKRIGKSVKKKSLDTSVFQIAKRALITALNDLGLDVDKSEIPNELIKDYYLQLFEEKKLNGIRQIYSRRNTRHDLAPCCSFFVASNFFNQFTFKNYIKFKSNIMHVLWGEYIYGKDSHSEA